MHRRICFHNSTSLPHRTQGNLIISTTKPLPQGHSDSGTATISAQHLTVQGAKQTAPVTFSARPGELVVVEGSASSGKTALLLTIGARMRPVHGKLCVLGYTAPHGGRHVRARCGIGPMRGVNDLDDALTVEQHIAERMIFHQQWWKPWVAKRRVQDFTASLNEVIGSLRAPREVHGERTRTLLPSLPPKGFVSDLPPLERFMLSTALALVGEPEILLIDDIDQLRDSDDRIRAWVALGDLLQRPHQPTVVVTCQDASDKPSNLVPAHTVVLSSAN